MLSNRITPFFSVLLMLLTGFTGIADAQQYIDIAGRTILPRDFAVIAKHKASVEAENATDDGITVAIVEQQLLPDLAHFFNTDVQIFGGTLEVMLLVGNPTLIPDGSQVAAAPAANLLWGTNNRGTLPNWNDLVVTEIMWGHDKTPQDPADPTPSARTNDDIANKQWIEIFNNTNEVTPNYTNYASVALRFIPDQYSEEDPSYDGYAPRDPNNGPYYSVRALTGNNTDPIGQELFAENLAFGQRFALPPQEANQTLTAQESGSAVYVVVDRVSNVRYARWALPGNSGNTQLNAAAGLTSTKSLVSAYRAAVGPRGGIVWDDSQEDFWRPMFLAGTTFLDGTTQEAWKESLRRRNIRGPYVATPRASHIWEALATTTTQTVVPSDSVVINEFRDDVSDENDDWIEFHNRSDVEVNINDWNLSYANYSYTEVDPHQVIGEYDFISQDDHDYYYDLPDVKIPAGGYLLIANREPHDTPLGAKGSNLAGGDDLQRTGDGADGAKHKYYVDKHFMFPPILDYLIVLRNKKPDFKNGDSEDAYIEDIAGAVWDSDSRWGGDTETFKFNTHIWPLKGWQLPPVFYNADGTVEKQYTWADLVLYDFKSDPSGVLYIYYGSRTHAWARKGNKDTPWFHKDAWEKVGHKGGLGYDRNTNLASSPGTPGYPNDAKGKLLDLTGDVTISEIMYDAGPRLDMVQWIEVYNASQTHAVNLKDWTLTVRNIDDDDVRISPVDARVKFTKDVFVLPNQTLLIVSAVAPNNLATNNHIYNLAVEHKDKLSLRVRRDVLLSEMGFYIALHDKEDNLVDEAGNLEVSRGAPTTKWTLLPGTDDIHTNPRKSIRRVYGLPKLDSNGQLMWGNEGTDTAANGLASIHTHSSGANGEEVGWVPSDLAGTTHYGHRSDYGNPGYRRGGPLPVSLSSFRPVRDKATGEVVIRWVTESELSNAGFNILRSETKNGQFKVVNVTGIIPGHGTTSEKHVYEWKDTTAKPNVVYYYQIEDVSFDGKRTNLATTHLRGNVNAAGKLTTTWGDLKTLR